MVSLLLRYLLPFLAPFVGYFVWVWLMRKFGAEREWTHPWHLLFLAGALCLLAMLGGLAMTGGAPAGSTYVPPEYTDGRIVPGHHLPPTP